jgi:hypothetical protein
MQDSESVEGRGQVFKSETFFPHHNVEDIPVSPPVKPCEAGETVQEPAKPGKVFEVESPLAVRQPGFEVADLDRPSFHSRIDAIAPFSSPALALETFEGMNRLSLLFQEVIQLGLSREISVAKMSKIAWFCPRAFGGESCSPLCRHAAIIPYRNTRLISLSGCREALVNG